MAYTRTTWVNGSGGGTPVSAANLNNMELELVALDAMLVGQYGAPATTLPGSPVDKQQAILVDSTTAPTYAWLFQYSTTISDAHKWLFVGGSPIETEVATAQGTASTSYAALATAGPNLVLPVAGIYIVEHGYHRGTENMLAWMSYDIGGTGAVDADGILSSPAFHSGNHDGAGAYSRAKRQTLATAMTLTAKYKTSSGTANFDNRWMKATPVRCS